MRALLGGDQLTRLRRGCFAVALLFCIAQIPNVMTLERPLGQRGVGLVALLVISLTYTIAYRRGTVSPAMRVSVIGAIVVATPILGSAVMGAAVTGAWMLALYPSRSLTIQGAALGLAAAVGGSIGINGAHEPASAVGAAITVPMMMLVLGQLRASLTERDELHELLARQALLDEVTELPNRHAFQSRLDAAAKRRATKDVPYTVLLFDLDGFKRINDLYGHDQGDEVLAEVARRATACIRDSDCCARLGGDEFAIVVEATDEQEMIAGLVRRLEQEIERPIMLDDTVDYVGASVGATSGGPDPRSTLRDADRSMYAMKAHRTNGGRPRSPDADASRPSEFARTR